MQTSDPKGPKWPILMYLDNVNKEPLFIFEIGSDMILYGFQVQYFGHNKGVTILEEKRGLN